MSTGNRDLGDSCVAALSPGSSPLLIVSVRQRKGGLSSRPSTSPSAAILLRINRRTINLVRATDHDREKDENLRLRRFQRLVRQEQGFALVITLGVSVVFGLMVVTVIESARSNSRSGTMSVGRMSAYN